MGSTVGVGFLILLGVAVLLWLIGRPRHANEHDDDMEVDREVLEQAEDEVKDLDAFTSPEEADDDLPDWGPGAPRP